MATFTRIPDEERPSITLDPSAVISKIEDNTYGGFTEYVAVFPLCPFPLTPLLPLSFAASSPSNGLPRGSY